MERQINLITGDAFNLQLDAPFDQPQGLLGIFCKPFYNEPLRSSNLRAQRRAAVVWPSAKMLNGGDFEV